MTKKVIFTGFLPFGGYKFNPSEDIVGYFNSCVTIPQIEIVGLVLPCTYFGAYEKLSKIIDKEKPDAIISMGLSSSVKGIRIETTFCNLMSGKYPDMNGYAPSEIPICKEANAKEFLTSNVNNIFLANILYSKKIPVEISANADNFICNSLGYLTTKKIFDNNLNIRNMFINIPWTDDYKDKIVLESGKIFLEKEKLYTAVKLLIKHICY